MQRAVHHAPGVNALLTGEPVPFALLLCTDGIVEHGRRSIDEGTARLTAALEKLTHCP